MRGRPHPRDALPSTFVCESSKATATSATAPGQNRALETVSSDYHLILNPDVFLGKGRASRRAAVPRGVTPKWPCSFRKDSIRRTNMRGFRSDIRHCSYCCCARSPCAVLTGCLGAAWRAIRTAASCRVTHRSRSRSRAAASCCAAPTRLKKVNGFDERYFLYFEDYDLSLRVKNYGQIVELPQARITHYGGHTARRDLRRVMHFLRSGVRFFNRYGWRIV